MRKRYLTGIILIIITVFLLYTTGMSKGRPMETVLQKMFKVSGADLSIISVNAWAQINSRYMDKDKMDSLIKKIQSNYGYDNKDVRISKKEYEKFREVKLEYSNDVHRVVAILQTLNEKEPQSYLIINEYSKKDDIVNGIRVIKKNFEQLNRKPEISIVYEGTFNGHKSYNELEAIKAKVLKSVRAAILSDGNYNNYRSITAFTPEINEYISIGGEKININMAMRYSSYDNKTHIYVASPVITSEY